MRNIFTALILLCLTNNLNAQYIYPKAEYSSFAKEFQLTNLDIKDTILYLPLGEDGLHILNIADLDNIKELSVYTEYDKRSRSSKVYGTAYKVEVVDNMVYLAFGDLGLKILDVTDPTMPYVLGTYYRYQQVYTFELFEHFALLGYIDMGVEIIDLTNINDMKMVARKSEKGFSVRNIQIAPPYLVLSGGKRGLKTLKFNDPFNTFKQAQFPRDYLTNNEANKLLLRGNAGYLANDYRGLTVFNMGLPLYPLEVFNVKTEGRAVDLLIDGNYLYVAGEKSIEIFDIKEPEKPAKVFEHIDKNKDFKCLKMHGDKLFAAYSSSRKDYGIVIFQVE